MDACLPLQKPLSQLKVFVTGDPICYFATPSHYRFNLNLCSDRLRNITMRAKQIKKIFLKDFVSIVSVGAIHAF